MLRLLPLMILLLAAMPAAAQQPCPARRHVDCAGAARAVEAAIAGDPWLALIDQAQRMRIAELAPLLGAQSAAELADQQAAWRRSLSRDLFFHPDGTLDEADPRGALRGAMEARLVRLMRIEHDPPGSIDGNWVGVQGQVVVERAGGGHYRISVSTIDVNNLAWMCDYDGEGDTTRVEWLETRDGALELRREGAMLRVRMLTRRPSDFCGAAGSMSGLYFRIGNAP
ncbi:hypothetical protein [Roseomonas rosulenta]|uniref:hypothetical protein n=1 Tax=Roseomonas rosulenta TaxID=2748667 RepID=UPI0018DFDC63|nr:hypothetical protein [Roseomonas rosulenta]